MYKTSISAKRRDGLYTKRYSQSDKQILTEQNKKMNNEIVFFLLTLFVLITNILWYWVKSILKENEFKVNYFYGHLKDIPNFYSLIKSESNFELKSKYRKLFFSLIFFMISTTAFMVYTISYF